MGRLSVTVFDILSFQRCWGDDLDLLGLCQVIGHVTIGLAVCGFLLVVSLNRPFIVQTEGRK